MALYAFDGTWNREHSAADAPHPPQAPADLADAHRAKAGLNTNVQRFFDLYEGTRNVYLGASAHDWACSAASPAGSSAREDSAA